MTEIQAKITELQAEIEALEIDMATKKSLIWDKKKEIKVLTQAQDLL